MPDEQTRIAIIGGGHMGSSILSGLLDGGKKADQLLLIDPNEPKREAYRKRGVTTLPSPDARLEAADLVLFAVKPQATDTMVAGLREYLREQQLVVSIIAGISSESLASLIGRRTPIVRCMPNVPVLHRAGITGLYANPQVSEEQRALAEDILSVVGDTEWFSDEGLIDTVTAISGSGPAYFFYLMEIMQREATQLGMSQDAAYRLVAATAWGAAQMVRNSDTDFSRLRRMVTSPKGTTEAAIITFDHSGSREAIANGIHQSWQRSRELGREFNG